MLMCEQPHVSLLDEGSACFITFVFPHGEKIEVDVHDERLVQIVVTLQNGLQVSTRALEDAILVNPDIPLYDDVHPTVYVAPGLLVSDPTPQLQPWGAAGEAQKFMAGVITLLIKQAHAADGTNQYEIVRQLVEDVREAVLLDAV